MKYSTSEIIDFLRDFKPSITEEYDEFKKTGKYNLFTIPTQHCRISFDSYEEALEYGMDFIKEGNWKVGESPIGRFENSLEMVEFQKEFECPSDEEIFDFLKKFINGNK